MFELLRVLDLESAEAFWGEEMLLEGDQWWKHYGVDTKVDRDYLCLYLVCLFLLLLSSVSPVLESQIRGRRRQWLAVAVAVTPSSPSAMSLTELRGASAAGFRYIRISGARYSSRLKLGTPHAATLHNAYMNC